MKQASASFLAQLEVETTTLCRLWRITPLRGGTLYFTDHDQNITHGGNLYISTESFSASSIEHVINSGTGNLEITAIREVLITREDVERGIYDGAITEIDAIFYDHIDYGTMALFTGIVSASSLPNKNVVVFALLGSGGRGRRRFMEQYSTTCRATFCDARCTLSIATFATAMVVDSVESILRFTASEVAAFADDHFKLGSLVWATGANAGIVSEVATSLATGSVTLLVRTPYPVEIGDTGSIRKGCDKTLASCDAYGNKLNFRGEPYVPGDDFTAAPVPSVPNSSNGGGVMAVPDGWQPGDAI